MHRVSPPHRRQHLNPQPNPFHLLQPNQKLSLQRNTASRVSLDLDTDVMNRAVNRSYTRHLARSKEVRVQDVLENFANFALTLIEEPDTEKQLQQFWCIIALNESALKNVPTSLFSCGSPNIFDGDPSKLTLYQLFIGLGKRQLRFQSLAKCDRFYVFNMDTVEAVLAYSDVHQPVSQNHIRVIVESTYDFDFYFAPHTLPFNCQRMFTQEQCKNICRDLARQTDKILRASIMESKGKIYSLRSKELPDQNFLQKRYATEQQFSRYAQTGDIILFRDNHTFAKVQRFFTNSQCDHIGMIFRDQRYGICIFESNSGTGVSLAMWNQLIRYKWYQNIEGIYWRRLNMMEKPVDFQERIKEFVKVNLHKQYGISIGKLLSFKEVEYKDPQQQKNRTYFCSQLVAALYKFMNLLQPGKPSSTYLPKDFTDKGSLNMINNSALQAERRLVFNPALLKENYRFYK